MDLLGENPVFDIDDDSWRIRSRTSAQPPQFVGEDAVIKNSIITEGCVIEGTVINSVISEAVRIEKDAVVKDSVIMSGTVIKQGATVEYSIIDEDTLICENCCVGADKKKVKDVTVIGAGSVIDSDAEVVPGTVYSSKNEKGGKR